MARKGGTVRFDDNVYSQLEEWAWLEGLSSVPALVESIMLKILRSQSITVPERVKQKEASYDSLADLAIAFADVLSQTKISEDRRMQIMDGQAATEAEILRIAIATGFSEEYLCSINRSQKNGNKTATH
jgi:hypothetical protein